MDEHGLGNAAECQERIDENSLCILIRLEQRLFAVPADLVEAMMQLPGLTPVPGQGACMRGLMQFREKVIPLVDLRRCANLETSSEQDLALQTLLEERIQDHRNWLGELEASVLEKRAFTGALDPNLCKLGRWLNSLEARELTVRTQLQRIRSAHASLHAVATQVIESVQAGREDEAKTLIEQTRQISLGRIIELFAELRVIFRETRREIAVVLRLAGSKVALGVDAVVAVERLRPGTLQDLELGGTPASPLIRSVARRAREDSLVQILNLDELLRMVGTHHEPVEELEAAC